MKGSGRLEGVASSSDALGWLYEASESYQSICHPVGRIHRFWYVSYAGALLFIAYIVF